MGWKSMLTFGKTNKTVYDSDILGLIEFQRQKAIRDHNIEIINNNMDSLSKNSKLWNPNDSKGLLEYAENIKQLNDESLERVNNASNRMNEYRRWLGTTLIALLGVLALYINIGVQLYAIRSAEKGNEEILQQTKKTPSKIQKNERL